MSDIRVTPTHRIDAAHQLLAEAAQEKADLLAVIRTLEDQVAAAEEQLALALEQLPADPDEEPHGEAPPLP